MRGIIADCVFNGDKDSINISAGIDPFRLRQYLLYWDKIDYPSNNIIYVGLTPEEKYLEELGILQRTHVKFYSTAGININPEIMIRGQLHALEKNNKVSGEIWTLGQNLPRLMLPDDISIKENTIHLELINCLPVPAENTAFDDILNFKEKRRDELIEFRRLMDAMYDTIVSSDHFELQKNRCVEELQNKIIDINRVMNESGIRRFLTNMNVELNISDLAESAMRTLAGYKIGEKIGFPELGAVFGLATSAISVTYDMSTKAKVLPDGLRDYAYLFHAKKEIL